MDFKPQSNERNKQTIYKPIPGGSQGIKSIWDWKPLLKKYVRRNSGNCFYTYVKTNGKQISRCFETIEQARLWRRNPQSGIHQNLAELTFGELSKQYFENISSKVRPTTVMAYESRLMHLKPFDEMHVSQITSKTVDAWLHQIKQREYLEDQHSTRLSYEKELGLLKRILDFYHEYRNEEFKSPIRKRHREDAIIDHVRLKRHRSRNKDRYLEREEVEQFLNAFRQEVGNEKLVYWLLATFQLSTGLRIGEACALSWKDIDLTSGIMNVCRTIHWARGRGRLDGIFEGTKTGESREVVLVGRARDVLHFLAKSGSKKGLVFSKNGIDPLKYRSIQYFYDKALRQIGSKQRGTHLLRHSFATDFASFTGNMKVVSMQMGHRDLRMTNHYAKTVPSAVRKGVEQWEQTFTSASNLLNLMPEIEARRTEELGNAGNEGSSDKSNSANS